MSEEGTRKDAAGILMVDDNPVSLQVLTSQKG